MMPPGHVAVTWGITELLQHTRPRLFRLDYRLLGLCALLPDLLDKPLALLVFTRADTSQLIAHSLLFNVMLLLAALLWLRAALPYVLAVNGHLLADRMWNHTETFWWPLFGWRVFWQYKPMNSAEEMAAVYWDIITRYPQVWVVELVALGYLLWLAARQRWFVWAALKTFLLAGRIQSPAQKPSTRTAAG